MLTDMVRAKWVEIQKNYKMTTCQSLRSSSEAVVENFILSGERIITEHVQDNAATTVLYYIDAGIDAADVLSGLAIAKRTINDLIKDCDIINTDWHKITMAIRHKALENLLPLMDDTIEAWESAKRKEEAEKTEAES